MDKQEFNFNELKHIEPYRLIKDGVNNQLDNFFLVLAVVFNDLKGIVLFETLIVNNYRKPPADEISAHAGEYGGVFTQTHKIFIANIQEFLKFLKESKEIFETSEFKDLLSRASKDTQTRWKDIIDIAFEKSPQNTEFNNYLIKIRNNVSFHYYQSDKNLKKSFCNYFGRKEKIGKNDLAYYSLEDSMEKTRFFYADAATAEYLISGTGDTKEFNMKYQESLRQIIGDINFAILRLMKVYLKNRPK